LGCDADDRIALIVQNQLPSDGGRVAGKTRAPESVANYRDAVLPGVLILVRQEAPLRSACAQLLKKSVGDAGDVENSGLICPGERPVRFPARGRFLQGTGLRADCLKSGPRWAEGKGREHGCLHVECNDARRIFVWQRAQNHCIHDAKDGGVGANAEGES